MKARRKSDGKIIEVETYMLNSRRGKDGSWESSYKDIKSGLVYEESELDFNFDADTVIQGWVARDVNPKGLCLYTEKPERIGDAWYTLDVEETAVLIPSLFPDLTWESEPLEVEIQIKRKKK